MLLMLLATWADSYPGNSHADDPGKNTGDEATSVLLMWVKIPKALVPVRSVQQLLFNSKRGLESAFTENVWCEFKKNYSPTSPPLQI